MVTVSWGRHGNQKSEGLFILIRNFKPEAVEDLYTIIDIETTGNGLKGNKITEISIFKFDGNQVVDEFTSLVNPEAPIPHFITGLTGIDDQMVQHAPTFQQIADTILEMTKDCIFVAHSVNFDYGVIKEEFKRLGTSFSRKKLCTVRLSRKLIPGLQSYSLGKLCRALDVPLTDRHRARGDAHATVLLFKILLAKEGAEPIFKSFLNARSQEATLPPLLPKSVVDAIPQAPGIYFFKDKKGAIIYVGKAINLKKRVLGHFYDKSNHEIKMCREIADIDFELSGSELMALLMESAAIKSHYPPFNRAQKKKRNQYAIFSYEDRKGIVHLAFNPLKNVSNPLMVFTNLTECRGYLEQLCIAYGLCPKYCHLQATNGPCNHYKSNGCSGICSGDTTVIEYNGRVTTLLDQLQVPKETYLIERKGRNPNEKAFILIENGDYKGYGFVENDVQITGHADLEAYLIPQQNTVEVQRILRSSLKQITPLV